jgi:hypothetical protein
MRDQRMFRSIPGMKAIAHLLRSQAGKITLALIAVSLLIASEIDGVFGYDGEKIIKIQDLPDTEQFTDDSGAPLDLAYIYKQIKVLWILPVWNYDGRWCLHDGASESYYEIDKAEFDQAVLQEGLSLPSDPALPLWDRLGGKIVLIAVALFGFAGLRVLNAKDESEDTSATASAHSEPTSSFDPTTNEQPAYVPVTYHIARGSENLGEFTLDQIRTFLTEGSLSPEDFFFDTTRDEWASLTTLPDAS